MAPVLSVVGLPDAPSGRLTLVSMLAPGSVALFFWMKSTPKAFRAVSLERSIAVLEPV